MIFVDSSAFLAVIDVDDRQHQSAQVCWRNILLENHALLTNNYVIVETVAITQKRLGLKAIRDLQQEILSLIPVEWIDEARHQAAIEMVLRADRRRLSLVDCSCFLTMRSAGIDTAFTFDPHFGEQGFTVIP
jgi:predicted nucleic acid-binding protein